MKMKRDSHCRLLDVDSFEGRVVPSVVLPDFAPMPPTLVRPSEVTLRSLPLISTPAILPVKSTQSFESNSRFELNRIPAERLLPLNVETPAAIPAHSELTHPPEMNFYWIPIREPMPWNHAGTAFMEAALSANVDSIAADAELPAASRELMNSTLNEMRRNHNSFVRRDGMEGIYLDSTNSTLTFSEAAVHGEGSFTENTPNASNSSTIQSRSFIRNESISYLFLPESQNVESIPLAEIDLPEVTITPPSLPAQLVEATEPITTAATTVLSFISPAMSPIVGVAMSEWQAVESAWDKVVTNVSPELSEWIDVASNSDRYIWWIASTCLAISAIYTSQRSQRRRSDRIVIGTDSVTVGIDEERLGGTRFDQ